MEVHHSIVTSSPREIKVLITLVPMSELEEKLLVEASKQQIDISDGMIEQIIVAYLKKRFSGMAILSGDFLEEPGKMLFTLQSTQGIG